MFAREAHIRRMTAIRNKKVAALQVQPLQNLVIQDELRVTFHTLKVFYLAASSVSVAFALQAGFVTSS